MDTLPALRRLLMPRLQDKAASGASEMKKANPNLDTLQTITFGAIGSCELLAHCHIAASCGRAVSKKRQLSFKNVLCVIDYALDSCQGSLQRRNKGSVGTPLVNPGGTGGITWDRVDRTACAEFRALAAMEKLLQSQMASNQTSKTGKTGKMTIAVSEPPCVSCLAAMVKFSEGYPEIQIEVCIDGSLLRFGTEVGQFKKFSELEDGGDATEPVGVSRKDAASKLIRSTFLCTKYFVLKYLLVSTTFLRIKTAFLIKVLRAKQTDTNGPIHSHHAQSNYQKGSAKRIFAESSSFLEARSVCYF